MNKNVNFVIIVIFFLCAIIFFICDNNLMLDEKPTFFMNKFVKSVINKSQTVVLWSGNWTQKSNENIGDSCITPRNKILLEDAVEVLSSRNVSNDVFYFIETSQLGILKPRQMCAIESTAKVHPQADVYVLVVYPPDDELDLELNYALQLSLRHYPNIQVLSLKLTEYFQDTLLEDWYLSGKLNHSEYPLHHFSDVLRILTVYRFGGTYLDLDFITKKSLSNFTNFLCPESDVTIANGGLGFQQNHFITRQFVEELRDTFDGSLWSHNGPEMITRVMTRFCNVSIANMTKDLCGGITVLDSNTFYPIPYQSWERYFDAENFEQTMQELSNSPAVHVWNKLSEGGVIALGSQQPYSLLAKEYCPRTYWSCDTSF